MHVMLDLETMGTHADAPIVAIGACRFDDGGLSEGEFYCGISLQSAIASGATPDASTIIWWMRQSDAARGAITAGDTPMDTALAMFSAWISEDDQIDGVWGNGAAFDNMMLSQAYRRLEMTQPWPFWLDRCYRTVKAFSDVEMDRNGTHHNALDDAKSQAAHLVNIWKEK